MFITDSTTSLFSILIFYMVIYNFSLSVILIPMITYAKNPIFFSDFRYNTPSFYFTIISLVGFFSLAGVPPFSGFFSKVLLLNFFMQANSGLIFFFFIFFLLVSLFFYLKHIRVFLQKMPHSSSTSIHYNFHITYFLLILLFLIFLTPLFLDDLFIAIFFLLY
uniref:NADH dehydrogenase subunit 2-b n=1 Tax=Bakuella subtropica TaxID=1295181 RepID=UPI0023F228DC|nr:NADH dehydrogenase subunit 2-b [Bakuella subtropica]WDY80885.1 NADH dehydrogenase subunit 2-b [Bakuella subtropica]